MPDRTAGPSSGGMGRRTLVTFVGGRRRVVGGAAAGHNENVARAPSGGSRGARAAAAELVCGLGHIIPLSAITSLSCDIYADVGGCGDPMHALVRIACVLRKRGRAADAAAREACLAARRRLPGSVCPVEGRRGRVVAWCFSTVAWFKSLCVCGPRSSRPSADRLPCLAVVRRCPCCAGGLVEWAARPTTTVVSSGVIWVRVRCNPLVPWLVREPRGWGFRGCVVAAGGQAGVGRVTTAQARGQLATDTGSVARSG